MRHNTPHLYLLPGMTASYPVYGRLAPLLSNASVVPFIEPHTNESLGSYAARFATRFNENSYIAGVSFGGMLALEVARHIRAKGCILIASVRGPHELPPWMRVWRRLGSRNCRRLLRMLGDGASAVPASIRTHSTMRVSKLAGKQGRWHRWATSAILGWTPNDKGDLSTLHIHGDADTTFPIRYMTPDVVVRSGRHALPVSHPVTTADAMNAFINA